MNRELCKIPLFLLAGWLWGMASASADTWYSYDALGRLTQASYSDGTIITYSYDTAGNRLTEKTPPAIIPVVTTSTATAITAITATVNGSVIPGTFPATVQFQIGTTTAYGTTTSPYSTGSGTTAVSFVGNFTNLSPATVYHYRAIATSVKGTVFGADHVFTTMAAPTIAAPQSFAGGLYAGVSQSINPNGVATLVYLQYGINNSYGSQTSPVNIGSGRTPFTFVENFTGFSPDATYHYRVVTESAAGIFYGPDSTFTTVPFTTAPVASEWDFDSFTDADFATFGNPAINDGGATAFEATLTGFGLTTADNTGIWADNSTSTRQLIARTGANAPGTAANFSTLSSPVYNNHEAVAFRGTLTIATGQATSTTTAGIWSSSSGLLSLVARQGSQAPGCPAGATFNAFTSLGLTDSSGAIILATLNVNSVAGVTATNDLGIWKGNTTADLALALRLGQAVGAKTLSTFTFLPTETSVNGQTRQFTSASGDLVCNATFSDKTTGLVSVIAGAPQVAAQSGLSAPGLTGANFASFSIPAINNNDHLAFKATLATAPGGITTNDNLGIWADNSSDTRQLIAQTGSAPAPGTTAAFTAFSDPAYNNNNAVAFLGTLKVTTGQATSTTASGIWCNSTGSLALVARQGSPAAGCPAGATFNAFTSLALPDQAGATNQGGVVFLATLNTSSPAEITASNNQGIWAVDTTGNLQLVARTGDSLNGNILKSLAFLSAVTTVSGQTRSYSQGTGDIVYLATFTDGTTGIFKVIFP